MSVVGGTIWWGTTDQKQDAACFLQNNNQMEVRVCFVADRKWGNHVTSWEVSLRPVLTAFLVVTPEGPGEVCGWRWEHPGPRAGSRSPPGRSPGGGWRGSGGRAVGCGRWTRWWELCRWTSSSPSCYTSFSSWTIGHQNAEECFHQTEKLTTQWLKPRNLSEL